MNVGAVRDLARDTAAALAESGLCAAVLLIGRDESGKAIVVTALKGTAPRDAIVNALDAFALALDSGSIHPVARATVQ